jgi:hypothetical protein
MKDIPNPFDPSEVEGISEITNDCLNEKSSKLDTLNELFESISYCQTIINNRVILIDAWGFMFSSPRRVRLVHEIDVLSRWIDRLKKRYNNILEDLKFEK